MGNGSDDRPPDPSRGRLFPNRFRAYFRRFHEAGIKVYFTELDIVSNITRDADDFPTKAQMERQADLFSEITKVALEEEGCNGLYLWDYIDQENTFLHPTPIDIVNLSAGDYTFPSPFTIKNGELIAKPAYFAMREAFQTYPKSYWVINPRAGFRCLLAQSGVPSESGMDGQDN